MRIWMVMAAALLCGCATELDLVEPEPELEPAAQTQPNEFRFIVPHRSEPVGEIPEPVVSSDPCDCPDMECVDEWAETNLACDVCVVLLCDDEWTPHVCHYC